MKGQITLYTTIGCPHCLEAKQLLKNENLEFVEVFVNKSSNVREWLKEKTGKTSVPQIFFNDTHVGGNSDLQSSVQNEEKWKQILSILEEPYNSNLLIPSPSDYDNTDETKLNCDPDPHSELVEELIKAGIPQTLRPSLLSKKFEHAFSGQDFIKWLCGSKDITEEEGIEKGSQLLKSKFVLPINNVFSESFQNSSKVFYRLNDSSNLDVLNAGAPENCQVSDGSKLAETLRNFVLKMYDDFISDEGKIVDYQSMKTSGSFEEYQKLARLLQRVAVEDLAESVRKAFFINIYNALVIHALVVHGPPAGLVARTNFYGKMKYIIGGSVYSLDDIENGVLRGNKRAVLALFPPFKSSDPRKKVSLSEVDPRIHFALNCGAKSCPPIKTYTAQDIDKELQLATESYLEGDEGIVITPQEGKTIIKVSSLFRWYSSDFGKSTKELLEWIASNLKETEKGLLLKQALSPGGRYTVGYLPYDWDVNAKT